MEWVRENWVFILFFILFIAMHFFGHGMHGGHGQGREDHKGHGGGEAADEHKGHSGEETLEKSDRKGGRGCC